MLKVGWGIQKSTLWATKSTSKDTKRPTMDKIVSTLCGKIHWTKDYAQYYGQREWVLEQCALPKKGSSRHNKHYNPCKINK